MIQSLSNGKAKEGTWNTTGSQMKKKEREEGESSLVRSDGGVDRNKYKRLEMPIFSGEHLNS